MTTYGACDHLVDDDDDDDDGDEDDDDDDDQVHGRLRRVRSQ